MGPIKINIKTDTSEYGGDGDIKVPDISDKVVEKDLDNTVNRVGGDTSDKTKDKSDDKTDSCYEYEGEDCFYTEPSSGVRYKWSKDSNSWVNTETGEKQASSEPPSSGEGAQQNYKMEDGTYVYVDRLTNKKHKWNLETNQWDEVDNDEAPEDDESEEDENMSEEERKARQYRKRKAAPGWDKIQYQKVNIIIITVVKLELCKSFKAIIAVSISDCSKHVTPKQGPIPLIKFATTEAPVYGESDDNQEHQQNFSKHI